MGLFGLGFLEIAVILGVGAFLVGPETLGKMAGQFKGGSMDSIPDEFKKIPEEFQKGLQEGEANARSKRAKPMKRPKPSKKPDEEEEEEK
jgi:Sec-independent protein translocase protein TatA